MTKTQENITYKKNKGSALSQQVTEWLQETKKAVCQTDTNKHSYSNNVTLISDMDQDK